MGHRWGTDPAPLTCGVPEHGPSTGAAPGQGFDHHSHAGDFVLWELLQGCLHSTAGIWGDPGAEPCDPRGSLSMWDIPGLDNLCHSWGCGYLCSAQPSPHRFPALTAAPRGEGRAGRRILGCPHLAEHHDHAVGVQEAAGVPLIQPQLCLHGQPGPLPEILLCGQRGAGQYLGSGTSSVTPGAPSPPRTPLWEPPAGLLRFPLGSGGVT